MAQDWGSTPRFRESSRAPLEVPAEVLVDAFSEPLTGRTANVSLGGLFLRLRDPLAVGSLIRFRIQLGSPPTQVEGTGEVVWIRAHGDGPDRPAGIGVQFRYLQEDDARLLRSEVEEALEKLGPEPEIPPSRRPPTPPDPRPVYRGSDTASASDNARRPARPAAPSKPKAVDNKPSTRANDKLILGMPPEKVKLILVILLFGLLAVVVFF